MLAQNAWFLHYAVGKWFSCKFYLHFLYVIKECACLRRNLTHVSLSKCLLDAYTYSVYIYVYASVPHRVQMKNMAAALNQLYNQVYLEELICCVLACKYRQSDTLLPKRILCG